MAVPSSKVFVTIIIQMSQTRSRQQLQGEIREQFQQLYKEKIIQLTKFYELKHHTLLESIGGVYARIVQDDILLTLAEDKVTKGHATERVKELFSEIVLGEREILIERLGTQITEIRLRCEEWKRKYDKLKEEADSLEKNYGSERLANEQLKNGATTEMAGLKEQIYQLKLELKNSEAYVTQQKSNIARLTEENEELQNYIRNVSRQVDSENAKYISRSHEVEQHQAELTQLKNLQEAEDSYQTLLQLEAQKHRKKVSEYKAKIEEYKVKIQEYKLKIQEYKGKIEEYKVKIQEYRKCLAATVASGEQGKRVGELERKISQLVREQERKIGEVRTAKDKDRAETERKYEQRMRELQGYYEKLLQTKVREVQQNTEGYIEKMQEEQASLRKYLSEYENNYMAIAQHEEVLAKRDQLLLAMKGKMEQLEEFSESLQQMHTQDKLALSVLAQEGEDAKKKVSDAEQIINDLRDKIKANQRVMNALKIQQKKQRAQMEQQQREIAKNQQLSDGLQKQRQQLQNEVKRQTVLFREKEQMQIECNEEMEKMSRRNSKLQQLLQGLQKEVEELSENNQQQRKQVSILEYQVKQQEHKMSLQRSNYEHQLHLAQSKLDDKQMQLQRVEEQCEQFTQELQDSRRKLFETQNILRQYQLQNQFYKETGDMHKNDGMDIVGQLKMDIVGQLKKTILDKNAQIDRLQLKTEGIVGQLKQVQIQNIKETDRLSTEANRLKDMLRRLCRKLGILRKELTCWKDDVLGRVKRQHNEDEMLMNDLCRHFRQWQTRIDADKDDIGRKAREEANCTVAHELRQIKANQQSQTLLTREKQEAERMQWRKDLMEKEERSDEQSKQLRKYASQLKKEREDRKELEKQLADCRTKWGRDKDAFEGRLADTIRSLQEERDGIVKEKDLIVKERDGIVKEYEQKRLQLEEQLEEYVRVVKRVKADTKTMQLSHEEEKRRMNSQLKTIREQEEAIQAVVRLKDAELAKLVAHSEQLLLSKQQIQSQLQVQLQNQNDHIKQKMDRIQQLQLVQAQLVGRENVLKSRWDRVTEENSQMKRQLQQKEVEIEDGYRIRSRLEGELRDIRGAISRTNKNQELRALSSLSQQTVELSNKVNQMRRMSGYEGRTPLRS